MQELLHFADADKSQLKAVCSETNFSLVHLTCNYSLNLKINYILRLNKTTVGKSILLTAFLSLIEGNNPHPPYSVFSN